MRLLLGVLAALCLASSGADAMDASTGRQALVGTWVGAGETWIFDEGGTWMQYLGGAEAKANYAVSAMPANMLRVGSSSGRAYIFHFSQNRLAVTVFLKGSDQAVSWLVKE